MIRISLPYIIGVVTELDSIRKLSGSASRLDNAIKIWSAKSKIEEFLNSSVFVGDIRSCRDLASQLISVLEGFDASDWQKSVQEHEVWSVKNAYEPFRSAMLAELGVVPSYYVTRKGAFDTISLLDNPLALYTADLAQKVPEAQFDVDQAAKALAFELATACGYHVFRVTECVLRRYYSHKSGGSPQPKNRNIGVYVKALRNAKVGDEKILSSIEQMAKHHRNPLIHPEIILTLDEAISTLGMSRSLVDAMLFSLPTQPPTTTTPTQIS